MNLPERNTTWSEIDSLSTVSLRQSYDCKEPYKTNSYISLHCLFELVKNHTWTKIASVQLRLIFKQHGIHIDV